MARSGLVNDYSIPDHASEADDDAKSEPGLVDSESEDEDGNLRHPERGHVRRRVKTIEASVMIHDKDDITEEARKDQFCTVSREAASHPADEPGLGETQGGDRDIDAVDTASKKPQRPHGGPPARKIGNRRFRMA